MKNTHLFTLAGLFALAMTILQACQKGELLETAIPKIVEITFTGSTSAPLEFVYDNVIMDSTSGQNNSFPSAFKMNITKGDQKIQVREKGKLEILRTYDINTATFSQKFEMLYDGGEIYDNSINYNLVINPLGKDLEFFLDGKIKYQSSYGSIINTTLSIPINKEQKRELTVKIKGEKEVLLTKTITAADTDKTLKFLLDGGRPVENITLPALKNPNGMSLTFMLQPNVEFGQTTFLGGDVDLVFYLRDMNTNEVTKLNPELRMTVPASQSFVTVELPPLPDSKFYTFDILKKGTNEVAYVSNDPSKKVRPGLGKYGFLFFMIDDVKYFLPGERLVCTMTPYEEIGGDNYDEIYLTLFVKDYLNSFVNIQ